MSNDTTKTNPVITIADPAVETQEPVLEKKSLWKRTTTFASDKKKPLIAAAVLVGATIAGGYLGRKTAPSIDEPTAPLELENDDVIDVEFYEVPDNTVA
jgi:hypothetical protein